MHIVVQRSSNESVSGCCLSGKVDLTRREDIPDNLKELFKDPAYKRNIRKYNQGLAFTSTGANVDNALANQRVGTYTYRIQGELVHQMGSLLPVPGESPKFAQIYFLMMLKRQQNVEPKSLEFPRKFLKICISAWRMRGIRTWQCTGKRVQYLETMWPFE